MEVTQKIFRTIPHCSSKPSVFHRWVFYFTKMAKEIILTQGKVAIVDDEDFDELNKLKWHADKRQNGKFYAVRKSICINGKYINQKMHRMIVGDKSGLHTDHIDGDTLNNRRSNLRICTHQQNMMNKCVSKVNKSGYKGVIYVKSRKMYKASITLNRKIIQLGYFYYIKQAAIAYNAAALKYHGEFANLNKID